MGAPVGALHMPKPGFLAWGLARTVRVACFSHFNLMKRLGSFCHSAWCCKLSILCLAACVGVEFRACHSKRFRICLMISDLSDDAQCLRMYVCVSAPSRLVFCCRVWQVAPLFCLCECVCACVHGWVWVWVCGAARITTPHLRHICIQFGKGQPMKSRRGFLI